MLTQELRNKIKDDAIFIKLEYIEYVMEPIIERILAKIYAKSVEEPKLLTIDDIARKFKVTKATIHNWKNRGSITGQKFGKNRYFTEEEIKNSMAKHGYSKQWDNRIEE